MGHPSLIMYKMLTIEDDENLFYIMVCTQCPYVESTYCGHKTNKWNKEETKLTCTACGIDGT